jgi:hypothetical protein
MSSTTRRLTRSNAGANLEELQALLTSALRSKRRRSNSNVAGSNIDHPVSKKSKDGDTDVGTPSPKPAQKKDRGQLPPLLPLPADVNGVTNPGASDRRRITAKAATAKKLKAHIRLKGEGLSGTKVEAGVMAGLGVQDSDNRGKASSKVLNE